MRTTTRSGRHCLLCYTVVCTYTHTRTHTHTCAQTKARTHHLLEQLPISLISPLAVVLLQLLLGVRHRGCGVLKLLRLLHLGLWHLDVAACVRKHRKINRRHAIGLGQDIWGPCLRAGTAASGAVASGHGCLCEEASEDESKIYY
jgi:hypothetical protein